MHELGVEPKATVTHAGKVVQSKYIQQGKADTIVQMINKSFVVGTKIATRVLKDGDRVEVDATKGVVRKLT